MRVQWSTYLKCRFLAPLPETLRSRAWPCVELREELSQHHFSSVHSLSHVQLFATPCTAARQASLCITNSQSLLRLMSIESVMPSNHLILCRPLLLPPSIFPSIRVFSNESALRIRWPKYWSFSFDISPSSEHSGLTSFRMNWLDLLAVQGTLKSLLQHQSSNASILWRSAFFVVQLSHPYVTTGKTIALTRDEQMQRPWGTKECSGNYQQSGQKDKGQKPEQLGPQGCNKIGFLSSVTGDHCRFWVGENYRSDFHF